MYVEHYQIFKKHQIIIVSQKARPGNGRALYYSSSTMNLVRFEKIEVEFFCIHLLLRLLSFSWLQFSVEWFTTFLIIHQGVVCGLDGLQMTLYRKKFVSKNIYFSICTSIIFLDNEGHKSSTRILPLYILYSSERIANFLLLLNFLFIANVMLYSESHCITRTISVEIFNKRKQSYLKPLFVHRILTSFILP